MWEVSKPDVNDILWRERANPAWRAPGMSAKKGTSDTRSLFLTPG